MCSVHSEEDTVMGSLSSRRLESSRDNKTRSHCNMVDSPSLLLRTTFFGISAVDRSLERVTVLEEEKVTSA